MFVTNLKIQVQGSRLSAAIAFYLKEQRTAFVAETSVALTALPTDTGLSLALNSSSCSATTSSRLSPSCTSWAPNATGREHRAGCLLRAPRQRRLANFISHLEAGEDTSQGQLP